MTYILTDEEILGAIYVADGYTCDLKEFQKGKVKKYEKAIAQAQVKKIHDWGNEVCWEHPRIVNGVRNNTCKRRCNKCWQSLLKGE